MDALTHQTKTPPSVSSLLGNTKADLFPLSGKTILICSAAKPASRDLCLILQSLGAQVVFYPVAKHPLEEELVEQYKEHVTIAKEEDLLALALKSDILIESDARISRWLHDHGLRDFGKLRLIIEQTDDGMTYWESHPPAPCAVVSQLAS